MTDGLVKAAKDSKELIVGKGIQKMFIPLDAAPGSKVKLSTGRRDEKDFEIFGYYEGAKGVSGDYWDFRSINSRYHYFIKCDISGKGVSAALIMVQVATMVINYFNDWKKAMPKAIDLTDLTYKINDFLEERQFVGRFAAFTLGVWDSTRPASPTSARRATASSTSGRSERAASSRRCCPTRRPPGPSPASWSR